MLKTSLLANAVFVLTGMTAAAQEGPTLERVWFDEYESACMAQMSTGEMGEVEAATWFRVAAARENNALASFYTVLAQFADARTKDGEVGILQRDQNGWSCKTGVVTAGLLQKSDIPTSRQNLTALIRLIGSKYSDPAVIQNYSLPDPMLVLPLRMTEPEDQQGYLRAAKALKLFIEADPPRLSTQEGSEPLSGLPITVIAPSLSGVIVRSGGTEFNGETILQLWRDRQRLFGAGLWSGSSPGVIFFSDDQGMVYVAGTDASQNFKIVSFEASEPKARYQELYDLITAEGIIGDDRDVEAEERMASAHPAFEIIMAHVKVHDAWTYTSWFMDVGRKTPALEELASSVNVALQELD